MRVLYYTLVIAYNIVYESSRGLIIIAAVVDFIVLTHGLVALASWGVPIYTNVAKQPFIMRRKFGLPGGLSPSHIVQLQFKYARI